MNALILMLSIAATNIPQYTVGERVVYANNGSANVSVVKHVYSCLPESGWCYIIEFNSTKSRRRVNESWLKKFYIKNEK